MLPTFLIADDEDCTRVFVIHTAVPRFIAEVTGPAGQELLVPEWIDPVADHEDEAIQDLMRAATAFYRRVMAEEDRRN